MISGVRKRSGALGIFTVTTLMAAILCFSQTPVFAADNFLANFGTSVKDSFHGVKATPDGGYAVTGQVGSFIVAAKINTYGNLEVKPVY